MGSHVKIYFEHYNTPDSEYGIESAWATSVGGNFQLDNILFYAPEYSWGDIVSVEDRDGELFVTGLVKESGHSTVRVFLENSENINEFREKLKGLGCDSEISDNPSLISIDIPPKVDYSIVKDILMEGEQNSRLAYEELCIAH